MLPVKELIFAVQYPFSQTAFKAISASKFDLENVSEPIIRQSIKMIFDAKHKKAFSEIHIQEDSEVLLQQIASFPFAKILLAIIQDDLLSRSFAQAYFHKVFSNLEKEKNDVLLQLADESQLKYALNDDFFVVIPIHNYLRVSFSETFMKLVNQRVDDGNVFLLRNDFCRFFAEMVKEQFLQSIPKGKKFSPTLEEIAVQVKEFLKDKQEKDFSEKLKKQGFELPKGKLPLDVECFPPCMSKLYTELLHGTNLAHMARFDLATFLVGIDFPFEQIIELFGKAPNFNESVTRYHIQNIKGNKDLPKYSCPTCAKIKEHGFCVFECGTKHPNQVYRKKLFSKYKKKIPANEAGKKNAEVKKNN